MKKYNVLLVDDSRVVHVEMIKMLADSEFQIHTYASSSLFVFCRLWKNSNYTAPEGSATIALY